jgi:hypothetical protein
MAIKKQDAVSWFPAEDEGWWESVIADEDKRPAPHVAARSALVKPETIKPEAAASLSAEITHLKPDWDRVRAIYDKIRSSRFL